MADAPASTPAEPTSVPAVEESPESKKRRIAEKELHPQAQIKAHLFGAKLCELVREAELLRLKLCDEENTSALQGIWFNLLKHNNVRDDVTTSKPWANDQLTHSVYAVYMHLICVSQEMKNHGPPPLDPQTTAKILVPIDLTKE